jgi:ABC-2 type transport system permease protein
VLNMIKMDVYRMFHTKSLYVIWIILLASSLFTSFLTKIDYDAVNKEWEEQQEQAVQTDVSKEENVQAGQTGIEEITGQENLAANKEQSGDMVSTEELSAQKENGNIGEKENDDIKLGMTVTLPTEPGKPVAVFDVFFSNAQGRFYALFLIIFAVMFSTADIKSGYIKNIGGQVPRRGVLVVSKAVALALFTVITLAGIFLFQAAANMVVFKSVVWGDWKVIIPYFLTQLVLNYAFVLICVAMAVIIKNNVVSMTLSVCLTMNMMSIIYDLISYAIYKIGIHNFDIYKYTITGKMTMLPMNVSTNDVVSSMCVAAAFIVIMLTLSSYIFQKRDI